VKIGGVRMNFVEGSYVSSEEAFLAVDQLQKEGYKKDDIRLVSNTATKTTFMNQPGMNVTTESSHSKKTDQDMDDDRSMWEKIKDAFSAEDYDDNDSVRSEEDVLHDYRDDIAKGNIVVVVKGDPEKKPMTTEHDATTSDKMTDDKKSKMKDKDLKVNDVHPTKDETNPRMGFDKPNINDTNPKRDNIDKKW
jgi:hypothetical protein